MNVAKRFGSNSQTSGNFNQSQMIEMLALPEGEEENFIAEKAAEGKPVEDMTIKQLRAEIVTCGGRGIKISVTCVNHHRAQPLKTKIAFQTIG